MTSEKLFSILKLLDSLDTKLRIQATLESVASALSNLASSPAQPQHQSSLASALNGLEAAASELRTSISPSQAAAIAAMGGEEFFDPSIYDKVKNSVQMNAMTPSVARDFVQDLVSRRSTFLAAIRGAKQNLEKLNVSEAALQKGSADLAFLIPRDIFKNELGPFAKELAFINRLVEHYSEAITGKAQAPELEQLSSSVPTIALLAAIPVIVAIGEVVNKFLDAWERIEKIRRMRAELADMGIVRRQALDELTESITTTVDEVVEQSTELVLKTYAGDAGRKNELRTAVRQDTLRLFGQIERGLSVEFRVNRDGGDDDDDQQNALQAVENLAKTLKFPEIAKEPILLATNELIEGEVAAVKQARKTTTRRTTTSQRVVKADDRATSSKE